MYECLFRYLYGHVSLKKQLLELTHLPARSRERERERERETERESEAAAIANAGYSTWLCGAEHGGNSGEHDCAKV
jgi:hypothetical protein